MCTITPVLPWGSQPEPALYSTAGTCLLEPCLLSSDHCPGDFWQETLPLLLHNGSTSSISNTDADAPGDAVEITGSFSFICLFCFFKVNMVFPFDWSLVCLPDILKRLTVRNQHLTFFNRTPQKTDGKPEPGHQILVNEQLSADWM